MTKTKTTKENKKEPTQKNKSKTNISSERHNKEDILIYYWYIIKEDKCSIIFYNFFFSDILSTLGKFSNKSIMQNKNIFHVLPLFWLWEGSAWRWIYLCRGEGWCSLTSAMEIQGMESRCTRGISCGTAWVLCLLVEKLFS